MIEKIVRNYLSSKLSVPVYMEIPEAVPASFVLVEKTGSSVENHIYSATIAIKSVASSLYNAALLNEVVKSYMEFLVTDENVTRVELNSDYNYTDTETKRYQYQAVFDITHY